MTELDDLCMDTKRLYHRLKDLFTY